jgi:hypothetical protein
MHEVMVASGRPYMHPPVIRKIANDGHASRDPMDSLVLIRFAGTYGMVASIGISGSESALTGGSAGKSNGAGNGGSE